MLRMDSDLAAVVKVIEESFGVEFKSGEIGCNSTISDIFEVLRSRLSGPGPHRCFTSIVYWRLRRAFVEILGVPKQSMRSWTSVEELIRPSERRKIWRAVGETAGLKVPGLEFSPCIATLVFWVSFVPLGLTALSGRNGWWIWASAATSPIVMATLFYALRPFAREFPDHCLAVGDVARTIVALNYGKLAQEVGPSRDREIAEALRWAIVDATGAEPRENTVLSEMLSESGLRSGGVAVLEGGRRQGCPPDKIY